MRYLIYLILVVSTSLNAGSIHKWVDDDGNTHYGDSPPLSTKTESVRVQSAPSNPGKALPRLNSPDSSDQSGTSTTAAADDTVPKDQAQIACDRAQEDLKVINRSDRIKLRAADGSSRYMTTEEITDRKNLAESDVDRFCN